MIKKEFCNLSQAHNIRRPRAKTKVGLSIEDFAMDDVSFAGFSVRFFTLLLVAAFSVMPAQAQSFSVGPVTPVLTTQQMTSFGVYYPDGAIGVLRQPSGKYEIFGAGGSFGGIGPGSNIVPSGTYKFAGSLSSFAPAQLNGSYPKPSLELGRLQPTPNGENFDRDYAGGGPTYVYSLGHKHMLVQIYHGEYHYNYPQGLPFYGGSGMAVSDNNGASFIKIGEILSPHLTQQQFFDLHENGGLPVDGFMIEAGVAGNHIDSSSVSDDHFYWYDIFTDRNSAAQRQGFAIARVSKTDLLEALSVNKAPLFSKYYEPGGGFTEPGLGGSSTLIVTQGTDFIAWPQVIYCAYLHKFLLFYQTNQQSIQVRSSANLMSWSNPVTLFTSSSASLKTFYPTAVGIDSQPDVLGKNFFLYFQQRNASGPLNPNYFRTEVTITP
jgi:hypothetical protein